MSPLQISASTCVLATVFATVFATTLATTLVASSAHGAVVFNTISNATFTTGGFRVGEYAPFAGETMGHDFSVSTRITLAGDGQWRLMGLGVRVNRDETGGATRARAYIAEASGDGVPLRTYDLGTISTTSTVPVTAVLTGLGTLGIDLLGGHSYWITLAAVPEDADATRMRWLRSSLGAASSTFSNDSMGTGGWTLADGAAPGIKLDGEVVPNPATIAAFLFAARLHRRRR